jgi:hypothetical protein
MKMVMYFVLQVTNANRQNKCYWFFIVYQWWIDTGMGSRFWGFFSCDYVWSDLPHLMQAVTTKFNSITIMLAILMVFTPYTYLWTMVKSSCSKILVMKTMVKKSYWPFLSHQTYQLFCFPFKFHFKISTIRFLVILAATLIVCDAAFFSLYSYFLFFVLYICILIIRSPSDIVCTLPSLLDFLLIFSLKIELAHHLMSSWGYLLVYS